MRQYRVCRLALELPGRLVGQDDCWVGRDRAADSIMMLVTVVVSPTSVARSNQSHRQFAHPNRKIALNSL